MGRVTWVKSKEVSITEADIARIAEQSRQREASEHRAREVRYEPSRRCLYIETYRGQTFSVNVDLLQGVARAGDTQISNIEILPGGEGLYWPDLDASLLVHGLCTGVYGSKNWIDGLAGCMNGNEELPETNYS